MLEQVKSVQHNKFNDLSGFFVPCYIQPVVRLLNRTLCSIQHLRLRLNIIRSWIHNRHPLSHDDVIKWKHFPRCWPFVRGIHRSPVNSPHKGHWRGVLTFCLICTYPYPEPVVFQWLSSGNPVCLELRPQCTLECHWRNASVLPVVFQWSSSGFPVVFQCVPIMQINTGSPLEHHWALASASVVPVAFQCTCGSSGLPVCSNYAN